MFLETKYHMLFILLCFLEKTIMEKRACPPPIERANPYQGTYFLSLKPPFKKIVKTNIQE